jgi:hypothetical protein
MRLYHYLPLQHAIEDLRLSRIKIATFDDLNDPFELMCYEMPTPQLRAVFERSKRDIARIFGVLCFSRSWRNPVLWSHYGGRHGGVCLGFEVQDEVVVPVNYTVERLSFDQANLPGGLTEKYAEDLYSTKYEGWTYEEEARVFCRLEERDAATGLYFRTFNPALQLKEVIAGPLCHCAADIRNALPDHATPGVRLVKARLAFKSFEVV